MNDTPENRDQDRLIREIKRTRWQQKGGGEEYQFYAYKNDPVTHALGPNVLDAGAGTGRFTIPLREKGFHAVGIDISPEMLAQGVKHSAHREAPFSCLIGDIERLPFPDAAFDSVVSITVLRHFPRWRDIFREYLRVTRPAGRIIFDMGSGDQRAFLARQGWKSKPNSAAADPLAFEAAITKAKLRQLAAEHNLRIVLTTPYDFFHVNDLLRYALGPDYDGLESQLASTMNTQGALALCEAVTRGIFPYLSPALTSSWLIVLEKSAQHEEDTSGASVSYSPTGDPKQDLLEVLRLRAGNRVDEITADVNQLLRDPDARHFYDFFCAHILARLPLESLCWEAKE
ncbi:MAG: methyltransferase domain-containing protein [Candidatus Hydrogenedentes bacterium]|nr:methyltransferase domain-containing protein [Candidatus Hydrogenedentota bacterium]